MGGIEKEIIQLTFEFLAHGHLVSVITTKSRFPEGVNSDEEVYKFPDVGVAVARLDGLFRTTLRGFQPSGAPLWVADLRRAVERERPDAVIFFNIGWPFSIRSTLSRLSKKRPTLFRTYYHPPGGRLHRWKKKWLLSTAAKSHRMICATRLERDQILQEGIVGENALAVIPPGVHRYPIGADEIDAARRGFGLAGRRTISHAARPGRFKGTDLLIRTLPAIQAGAGRDVALLVLGRSAEIPALQSLAAEKGVSADVVFAGEISDDRALHAALASSSLFALPSHYESLGIAFLEAMAEGLPVIGVPTGGVPEIIKDGGNGFLLSGPEAAEELCAHAVRLLNDPQKGRAMGSLGRALVEKNYLWSGTARKFLDVISELGMK
jgi:glycosyltransferase involved in cell wall biosynthesis